MLPCESSPPNENESFVEKFTSLFFSDRSKRRIGLKARASDAASRKRTLRLEGLEERALLSVSTAEYAAICANYPELNLPADVGDVNVTEIETANLSVENLKNAINEAGTTTQSDLIVLRTTSKVNEITYQNSTDQISIDIDSNVYGALNIVALEDKPLTINAAQKTRVLNIVNGTVGLADLKITGGKIADNGGGICVNGGELITSNVEISENQTTRSNNGSYDGGGGVCVLQNASFVATNTLITYNAANNNGSGGGVCVQYGGSFTATDSTISNNYAYYFGGGVLVSGTFDSMNTEFSNNKARVDGGGVCVNNLNGSFTATNSTISNNKVDQCGGGVCAQEDSNSFTAFGTTISENTAGSFGGGVVSNGTFTSTNTTISNNEAGSSSNGGGVYVYGGTYKAVNAAILENTANDGAGVYVRDGSFKTINATIAGNYSYHYGGGALMVYGDASESKALSVTPGTGNSVVFVGNQAVYGGAIDVGASANASFGGNVCFGSDGASKDGNSANYGGALYVADAASFADGGNYEFYYNTASKSGGAINACNYETEAGNGYVAGLLKLSGTFTWR